MDNLYNYTRSELNDYFVSMGEKSYKATQVFDWLYKKRAFSIDDFSNLKIDLRNKLKEKFTLDKIKIKRQEKDEKARKYLFELQDENFVEAVVMYHDYGISLCVSTQVGCNMGCKFCESGRLKKVRNLDTFEMVEQILLIEEDIKMRISSVVIMGIGEPLDNYDNVIKFIKIINDPLGLAIGIRHITLSTSGIVPKMLDLARESIPINLAVSLHAPNDEIRNKLMSVNKVYNISKVMEAIKEYILLTSRRVTIEYVMLKGINDSGECALELASLLKGLNVYVNLIPYNETNHINLEKSPDATINNFCKILKEQGINVTIRKKIGGNISAACGQLRSKEVEK